MIERACDGENAFDVIAVHSYERQHPGDMIQIDIKKLGRFDKVGHRITGDRTGQSNSRGVGREFVHVCIDDASRVALSQIPLDGKAINAVAFPSTAATDYKSLSVTVARVMKRLSPQFKALGPSSMTGSLG